MKFSLQWLVLELDSKYFSFSGSLGLDFLSVGHQLILQIFN